MLRFDAERVRTNVRQAETEDLLDRVTVYRAGMEDEALDLIEAELRARGVGAEEVARHAALREQTTVWRDDGTAAPCTFCHRPALARSWGWHRLWKVLPLFPRYYFYCDRHRPPAAAGPST